MPEWKKNLLRRRGTDRLYRDYHAINTGYSVRQRVSWQVPERLKNVCCSYKLSFYSSIHKGDKSSLYIPFIHEVAWAGGKQIHFPCFMVENAIIFVASHATALCYLTRIICWFLELSLRDKLVTKKVGTSTSSYNKDKSIRLISTKTKIEL